MRNRYPLNQSPLFCLRRRKGLAELLGVSLKTLENLANANPPEYMCFGKTIRKNGKEKRRDIEWPKKPLRRVQRRVAHILDRIEPPDYIQSGFRERSYIKNALSHPCGTRIAKIDIRGFFPNSSARWVRRCFVDDFQCSDDVAAILTKLLTFAGHLPTGGNASTIISFYAYRPMFDRIQELAVSRGLRMTCCVDDMTFSGTAATSAFLNEVRKIVQQHGLRTHKVHYFEAHQPKIVTGVALTSKGYRLPNVRRKKLHEDFEEFQRESDANARVKIGERLLGRAVEAAQIEARFQPQVRAAAGMLKEAKALAKATVVQGVPSGSGE